MTKIISSSYLGAVFDPERLPRTIEKTLEAAKALWEKHGYDTIAFSGMSGAAIAFILSHQMRIPILCVRKSGDSSHFVNPNRLLEGNLGVRKYLIVDDFISSGRTVKYIMDTISNEVYDAKCVAMLMYSANWDSSPFTRPESKERWDVVHIRDYDDPNTCP